MGYADTSELQREVMALRNRMEAAEAALAEGDRNITQLYYSMVVLQEFILKCSTAANPGMGGK